VTSNLPFSEWTQMIPNARLCKALIENIIDRAHTIKTGAESYPQNPRSNSSSKLSICSSDCASR
jgi:DNA replication protein DnaC